MFGVFLFFQKSEQMFVKLLTDSDLFYTLDIGGSDATTNLTRDDELSV